MILGIIGFGNMAQAISKGIIEKNFLLPSDIFIFDILEEKNIIAKNKFNFNILGLNDLIIKSDAILIAVKPDQLKNLLFQIKEYINIKKLIISICAGKKINFIANIVGNNIPIARVNPNISVIVGEGVTAISFNKNINQEQKKFTLSLFSSIGKVYECEEKYLNIITGIAGSGPAFVFKIINAFSDAGLYSGLSKKISTEIAAQTLYGAAKLILETNEHPSLVIDNVCSPGGTTIEGLYELEKKGFNGILIKAILKAIKKADKLSEE